MDQKIIRELQDLSKTIGDVKITYDYAKSIDDNMKANGVDPKQFSKLYYGLNADLLNYHLDVKRGGKKYGGAPKEYEVGVKKLRERKYDKLFVIGLGVVVLATAGGAVYAASAVTAAQAAASMCTSAAIEAGVNAFNECAGVNSHLTHVIGGAITTTLAGIGACGKTALYTVPMIRIVNELNANASKAYNQAINNLERNQIDLRKRLRQANPNVEDITTLTEYQEEIDSLNLTFNDTVADIQNLLDTSPQGNVDFEPFILGLTTAMSDLAQQHADRINRSVQLQLRLAAQAGQRRAEEAADIMGAAAGVVAAGIVGARAGAVGGPAAAVAAAAAGMVAGGVQQAGLLQRNAVLRNARDAAAFIQWNEGVVRGDDNRPPPNMDPVGNAQQILDHLANQINQVAAPGRAPGAAAPGAAAPAPGAAPGAAAPAPGAAPGAAAPAPGAAAPAPGAAPGAAAPAPGAAPGAAAPAPGDAPGAAAPAQGGQQKQMGGDKELQTQALYIALAVNNIDPNIILEIINAETGTNDKLQGGKRNRTFRKKLNRSKKHR
jgi:hypothetical protein